MLIAGVVGDLRNFTPKNLVCGSLGQTIGEWLAFPVSDFLDDSFSDFRDCLTPGGGQGQRWKSLRLPQVFYNQGLSSLRRSVSYVRAEH